MGVNSLLGGKYFGIRQKYIVVGNGAAELIKSLMEACATGRPCIATDIPGCKETIDNEINGYLVEVKSGEAIADAVNRFLCLSEEDKRHMAEKSYEKAKTEFDVNLVLKEYDELIDELIGELQN